MIPSAQPPVVSADWRFHHLGLATRRLAREADGWRMFGYVPDGDAFEDHVQGVRGIFLSGPGPRLELLEPLPESTVLDGWIDRGIRIYHQAFEVPDIRATLESTLARGAKVVVQPVPAIAFGGRLIAFVMLPMMHLVEFIDTPPVRRA